MPSHPLPAARVDVAIILDTLAPVDAIRDAIQAVGGDPVSYACARELLNAGSTPPTLIITALDASVMDAWRLCRLLRSKVALRWNPVPLLVLAPESLADEAARLACGLERCWCVSEVASPELLQCVILELIDGLAYQVSPLTVYIGDDAAFTHDFRAALLAHGRRLEACPPGQQALTYLDNATLDSVVLDADAPGMDAEALLKNLRATHPACVSIVIAEAPSADAVMAWMFAGATAWAPKPVIPGELGGLISHARQERTLARLAGRVQAKEIKAHETTMLLRHLAEGIQMVFWVVSPAWDRVYYVSPAYEYLWGHSRTSLYDAPKSWLDGVVEDDRDKVKASLPNLAVFAHGGHIFPEYRVLRPDGSIRWVSSTAYPISDASGEIYRIACICEDITARIEAEEALRESEERHRLALECGDLGVWDWHIATGRVICNPRWSNMLGYAYGEIVTGDKMCERLVHPDDFPEIKRLLDAHFAGETPFYENEHRIRHKDGHWVWVLDKGRVISRGQDGQPLRLSGTRQDITARKHAEEELRTREKLLQRVFDILPIGLWFADKNGTLLRGNPAGKAIWGAEPQVGLNEYGVFKARRLPSGDEIAPDDWALAHSIREGVTITDEMLEIDAFDGEKRVILNYSAPVLDDFGCVEGAVIVNLDITDRRRAEEERRKFEQQIQQTQKLESLGVLAGGIAHDFNNILMAVLGHAEMALLEMSPLSPARDSVLHIITASRRAADLCRQMLAYSGKASFTVERVKLRDLIEEMAHLLKTTISKKAILNLAVANGLPDIEADPSQLRQIVMNLIINASDAIGDQSGVITISTGVTKCNEAYLRETGLFDDLAPGRYVHMDVADTGCGMDAAMLTRIFEPFFTTKFTGRGLGLAAVLGIVRAHKGALKIYSEPGKGTTFRILLPALDSTVDEVSSEPALLHENWRGQGTILLADDEENVRTITARTLTRLGFDVLTAADGREAVSMYNERRAEVDIVILDLTMPHMDGAEAFTELRRLNPGVRVVVASGYSPENVSARFAGMGLVGVLQKPYTIARLKEVLSGM